MQILMRPRLYIHIGMSKAGSTAIQTALLRQEEKLQEMAILNPKMGRRRGAHWGLFREIRDAKNPVLFSDLWTVGRHFPVTVISCEGFWFLSDDGISRLADATKNWDVHILLFLRRPAGFLGSSYRQHIKSGKVRSSPDDFAERVRPRLAYDDLIRRWSRAFPITVRVYDGIRNEVEHQFLTLLGAGRLKPDRRVVNGTPSDGATRMMLLSNKCLSKRSRRLRVNRAIVSAEAVFAWLPPINDAAFQAVGEAAISTWDRDVLRRFIDPAEMDILMGT